VSKIGISTLPVEIYLPVEAVRLHVVVAFAPLGLVCVGEDRRIGLPVVQPISGLNHFLHFEAQTFSHVASFYLRQILQFFLQPRAELLVYPEFPFYY